jgi:hypothetical protein
MTPVTIRSHGWRALLLFGGVLALGGWRVMSARQTLDAEAAMLVRRELSAEYARGGDSLPDDRIAVRAMTAHDGADKAVVRAEVWVDGGAPPDGAHVRYFRLRRAPSAGWQVAPGRPSAFEFYTAGW